MLNTIRNILNPTKAYCTNNHDGDTITVRNWDINPFTTQKIRILGVQCPEVINKYNPNLVNEQGGVEAKSHTAKLVKGKWVTIIRDSNPVNQVDSFGRHLAYVEIEGTDIGGSLLQVKLAKVYDYQKKGFDRLKQYKKL